jgi:hypothetical protein
VGVLVICILYSEVFLTLTEVFPCFFLSCKANARVKLAKTGHGPHSFTLVVICVVRLLFVLFCVLFVCKCVLPPGDNPIAVNISNTRQLSPTFSLLFLSPAMTNPHTKILNFLSVFAHNPEPVLSISHPHSLFP